MQHILGTVHQSSEAEIIDDISPGKTDYAFMGVTETIREAQKRLACADIEKVNIYKIHDGVRSISTEGNYELVYSIS